MSNYTKHYYATVVDAIRLIQAYLDDPVRSDGVNIKRVDCELDILMCDLLHEINYG